MPAGMSNGNTTGTPLPGFRSSCKMKPTLQREQRLQKYANTHPLVGMRTSELADHKSRPFLFSFSELLSGTRAGEIAARSAAFQPGNGFVHPEGASRHFPAV